MRQNGLEVTAADVQNSQLQFPLLEKHLGICNNNFGIENRGKIALIRFTLYNGEMVEYNCWENMHACMKDIGCISCQGDPYVIMQESWKANDT